MQYGAETLFSKSLYMLSTLPHNLSPSHGRRTIISLFSFYRITIIYGNYGHRYLYGSSVAQKCIYTNNMSQRSESFFFTYHHHNNYNRMPTIAERLESAFHIYYNMLGPSKMHILYALSLSYLHSTFFTDPDMSDKTHLIKQANASSSVFLLIFM